MTEAASTESTATSSTTDSTTDGGDASKTTTTSETTESVATRKDWQAEAEKWKNLARKNEATAKSNAEKAAEFDKAEESRKSDLEKAQEREKKAEERANAAVARAVHAEVKALATNEFQDPGDVHLYLGDLSKYTSKDGDIDSAALESALKDIGKAKPNLLKQRTQTDVGVGARGGSGPLSMNDLIRSAKRGG